VSVFQLPSLKSCLVGNKFPLTTAPFLFWTCWGKWECTLNVSEEHPVFISMLKEHKVSMFNQCIYVISSNFLRHDYEHFSIKLTKMTGTFWNLLINSFCGPYSKYFRIVSYIIPFTTTQLCHSNAKAATICKLVSSIYWLLWTLNLEFYLIFV
jgi:hypothetical protein